MLEQLLKYSGFIYHIGGRYYYLGKWICKECCDTEASDCVVMYGMCRQAGEKAEAGMYFHKIRAYSDFALEIPYNPAKIKEDLDTLISGMSAKEQEELQRQIQNFTEDYPEYCG